VIRRTRKLLVLLDAATLLTFMVAQAFAVKNLLEHPGCPREPVFICTVMIAAFGIVLGMDLVGAKAHEEATEASGDPQQV
jgi:hypothetical protein